MNRRPAQPHRGAPRHTLPLCGLLLVLAGPAAAQSPAPNPYLAEARQLFQAMEYERCREVLQEAWKAPLAEGERAESALYRGLCLHGLGQEDEAAEAFRVARAEDPSLTPPSWCSPKVQAFFAAVAPPPPAATPPAEVVASAPVASPSAEVTPSPEETPRPEETPSPQETPRSSLVPQAPLPGPPAPLSQPQVQALPVAPLVLAGGAVAALGTGLFFGSRSADAVGQAQGATFESTWALHRDAAHRNAGLANVSFALAAASALASGVTWWLLQPEPAPVPAR